MAGVRGGVWVTWLEFISISIGHLAWPTAVVIGFLVFRSPIKALFDRIHSFGMAGAEAKFLPKQGSDEGFSFADNLEVQSDSASDEKKTDDRTLPTSAFGSRVQLEVKEQFKNEISRLSDAEARDYLISALAKERIEKVFSAAYANIFGSQIRALQLLNDNGGRISLDRAHAEFEVVRSEITIFKDWTLEEFLNYLKNFQLIEKDLNGVRITLYGRAFLSFLAEQGWSTNRPY
jgi:hypothetical protein